MNSANMWFRLRVSKVAFELELTSRRRFTVGHEMIERKIPLQTSSRTRSVRKSVGL